MEANAETELKLELVSSESAPELPPGRPGPGSMRKLVSTYYDTADFELARVGVSVRVRGTEGRYVQTVKADRPGPSAPWTRSEFEDEVAGSAIDTGLLESVFSNLGLDLPAVTLQPHGRSVVERTTWTLGTGYERVELAYDRGYLESGGRREPIHEIEIESKGADLSRLLDIALRIADDADVDLSTQSKARRALRLAGAPNPLPSSRQADRVVVPSEPMSTTLARELRWYVRRLGELSRQLREGSDAGALSEIFQFLEGYRAILTVCAEVQGRNRSFDRHRASILWIATMATSAREWSDLASLGASAKEEKALRTKSVLEAVSSRPFRRLLIVLHAWIEDGGWIESNGNDLLEEPLSLALPRLFSSAVEELNLAVRRFERSYSEPRIRDWIIGIEWMVGVAKRAGIVLSPEGAEDQLAELRMHHDNTLVKVAEHIWSEDSVRARSAANLEERLDMEVRRIAEIAESLQVDDPQPSWKALGDLRSST